MLIVNRTMNAISGSQWKRQLATEINCQGGGGRKEDRGVSVQ